MVLVGAGVGTRYLKTKKPSAFSNPQEQASVDDEAAGWKAYRNEKVGFEFRYPADHTVFSSIDYKNRSLVPASQDNNPANFSIHFAEDEQLVFGLVEEKGTPTLSIFTVNGESDWTKPGKDQTRKEILFSGRSAVLLEGPGNLSTPYKRIVIDFLDGAGYLKYVLIIQQNAKSDFLDNVLSTFKFTK